MKIRPKTKKTPKQPKRWWKVNYFYDAGVNFELSVCLEGAHGLNSWGWAGDDKIILLEGDYEDYDVETRKRFRQYAAVFRDALNGF